MRRPLSCAACGDKPVSRRTLSGPMLPICRDCARLSAFKWESACYEMELMRIVARQEKKP